MELCLGSRTENIVDDTGLWMVLETKLKLGMRWEQRWG